MPEDPIRRRVRKRVYERFRKLARLKLGDASRYKEVLDAEDRTYEQALKEEMKLEEKRFYQKAEELGLINPDTGRMFTKEEVKEIARRERENRRIARKRRERKELAFGLDDTSQHKPDCRCSKCNPEFDPLGDLGNEESPEQRERRKGIEREVNETIREHFSFCPRCKSNPCVCRDD